MSLIFLEVRKELGNKKDLIDEEKRQIKRLRDGLVRREGGFRLGSELKMSLR